MIKHIGTSAIMDLLLRMLTCIEPQQLRQDVLNVRTHIIYIFYICNYIYTFVHSNKRQLCAVNFVYRCSG